MWGATGSVLLFFLLAIINQATGPLRHSTISDWTLLGAISATVGLSGYVGRGGERYAFVAGLLSLASWVLLALETARW